MTTSSSGAAAPPPAVSNPEAGRRLDPDARRTEILDAALRVYAERPYAEVSTTDLAREAGVARGLLNHYFDTKRGLYLEALRVLLTIPEQAAAELPGDTRDDRAAAAVDWFLDTVETRRGLWLSVGLGLSGDAEIDAVVEEADETAVDRVLTALGDDPDDEERRARLRAFFGMVRAASREWLVRGSLDRPAVRTILTTTLVHLLPEAP